MSRVLSVEARLNEIQKAAAVLAQFFAARMAQAEGIEATASAVMQEFAEGIYRSAEAIETALSADGKGTDRAIFLPAPTLLER